MHMDERKPAIPSSEFRLRSAPARTAADIDPPPAGRCRRDELAAAERQRRSGQIAWYSRRATAASRFFSISGSFCRDRQQVSPPRQSRPVDQAGGLTLFESFNHRVT
jgi:hypothetical protein